MKQPAFSLTWQRASLLLLVLLVLLTTVVLGSAWKSTLQVDMVPRTIVPFSDLRRFQRMAEDLRPERLRSGERLQFEYSAEDLQKIATLLANGHPRTAQTQFEVVIGPPGVSIQAWWPTGLRERYLPVRILWHPDYPLSLQRLYVGNRAIPSWLVTFINARLDASAGAGQVRSLWRQYNPVIELQEQWLSLELEFQQAVGRPVSEQG